MSKKILIVEEHSNNSTRLYEQFGELGFSTKLVRADGFEFVSINPDNTNLIILNFELNSEDTLDLCRSLKKSPVIRPIPVITYSQEDELLPMVQAYEAGTDYYVVKNENSNRVLYTLIESILTPKARQARSLKTLSYKT